MQACFALPQPERWAVGDGRAASPSGSAAGPLNASLQPIALFRKGTAKWRPPTHQRSASAKILMQACHCILHRDYSGLSLNSKRVMMQMSASTLRAKAPVAQASSPLHVLATLVCEGDAALDVA